jgi:hypothetical protein
MSWKRSESAERRFTHVLSSVFERHFELWVIRDIWVIRGMSGNVGANGLKIWVDLN